MKINQKVSIVPNPKNILIKITRREWEAMFTVNIIRADGSVQKLFTDVEEDSGFEKRYRQNLSVGTFLSAGKDVTSMFKHGDLAIIDYLVTSEDDHVVGYHKDSMMISLPVKTTYHESDSVPMHNGRMTWFKGEIDYLSKLLGIVRMRKLIPFEPYIFLKHEDPAKMSVTKSGILNEIVEKTCVREVIGAYPGSGYKDGDLVIVKEEDLFGRFIEKKELSIIIASDILGVM